MAHAWHNRKRLVRGISYDDLYQKASEEPTAPRLLFGGDEGNRTPVRKSILMTFFVDSPLFMFPLGKRERTRYLLG